MKVVLLCSLWIFSILSGSMHATDHLTIISPHRKSIQNEYIPLFKQHYQKTYGRQIQIDWLDQGGTENDLRFVQAKYEQTPEHSNIDIFWGGGNITFQTLEEKGLLEHPRLDKTITERLPATIHGIPLRSAGQFWYASALSSFGILFNKRLLAMLKIPLPKNWKSLGDTVYHNHLSVADPRKSSSSLMMNLIILEALGWEDGWATLTRVAGNTKKFTLSSSAPIKAIVSGQAALATAIDFYASAKINLLGKDNLGFLLPPGETIINSDPIAILKGSKNFVAAQRFIHFVLSDRGQKLLLLAKGSVGGPKRSYLGRMAVFPSIYRDPKLEGVIDPFSMPKQKFRVDLKKISKIKSIVGDLVGALHIDLHHDLRSVWARLIQQKLPADALQSLVKPILTEKEMYELATKWEDNVFRNKMINLWTKQTKIRYQEIARKLEKIHS